MCRDESMQVESCAALGYISFNNNDFATMVGITEIHRRMKSGELKTPEDEKGEEWKNES